MPSRIKHIATMSQNSPRLRSFYELLFNLKRPAAETSHERAEQVGKAFGYPVLSSKRVARPFSGTVWGVDGNIGLSFNRRRPGFPGGLDHFGLEVDDIELVQSRIKERYSDVGIVKRPVARTFAYYSTHDPEGNLIDIVQPGLEKKRYQEWADDDANKERFVSHLAIRAMKPSRLAEFYVNVYGFQPQETGSEDANFYLSDGKVTLVLMPWKIEHYHETEHRGPGLDHIGFKVENLEAFKRDVELVTSVDAEWLSPQSPGAPTEHEVIMGLLRGCRSGRYQLADPEGNLIDVSE
jgi:catechol 2,3-dioxygenase-like lactoylglutathione lyase family enzyme